MSVGIKRRRGTTAEHELFTGLEAELTVDLTKKTVVVHDGTTAGGNPLATEANLEAGVSEAKTYTDDSIEPVTTQLDAKANQSTTYTKTEVDANIGVVQAQVDTLVVEGDSSVEAAQARVNSSGTTFETLKARLDDGDSIVSANADKLASLDNANATVELNLKNYLGNSQNIHPKVLHFENSWHGFANWMAYTPYPRAVDDYENPCIAVSNDLLYWQTPSGLTNPLDPKPENGYNSDTHLVYRADLDMLEIWWRTVYDADPSTVTLYRRTSTDGVTWTDKQVILSTYLLSDQLLSPAILFENSKYKMWYISSGVLYYRESTDCITWTSKSSIAISWGDLTPWHMDVIHTAKGYEMVVQAYHTSGGTNNTSALYYVLCNNSGEYSTPILILRPNDNPVAFDAMCIYRACVVYYNDMYYVYYSCIDFDWNYHMSLAIGKNIEALNGIKHGPKLGSKTAAITAGSVLTDYDVSQTDTLIIGGDTTINSFKGGYRGKVLHIVISGTTTKATLVYGSRLLLPRLKNFVLTVQNMGMTLICTNTNGNEFRGFADIYPITPQVKLISGTQSVSDYDLSNIDVVKINGTSEITFNSFVGGVEGQRVTVILGNANAVGIFVYGTRLYPPSNCNLTLDTSRQGVTIVCTDTTSQVWKVMA